MKLGDKITEGAIQILPIIVVLVAIFLAFGVFRRFLTGPDQEEVKEALVGIRHYEKTRDALTTR